MTSASQTRTPADGALAPPAGLRPGARAASRRAETRRKWYEIIGLTTPAVLIYVLFVLVPMGFAFYYSLFRWRGVGPPTEYVGFRNYTLAFQDPIFLDALRNNAIIVFGSLLIQGPVALGIALLLNRRFRGRSAFRLLVFVPYVLAEVTVGIMWKLILTDGGTLDALLRSVGLGGLVQAWLADLDVVIWTLLFVLTWKYVGFAIILLLAGLSNVPPELNEAAEIDGASWWQIQRHVTLPLLGPTIRIWMFLSMIGSLQVFDMVWVTSVPAVRSLGASATMATYMVDNGFFARLWGYGNAVAVILFAISFVAALLFQRFLLSRDIEGAITRKGK
ncbi:MULTISPECIES: carbohydrate ABC transporter permease [Micromonospora]|uniref:Sugar ABC transporter permease n=1 Tax=Micromonospora chalcea TaxID=1874 RepID=A0ABX9XZ24_MICCH|nr:MULTISPECIES: sugar ABC transporter permease [Micromonospora]EWM63258.1 L-arabinose transporter permease [Micromonospora sp. M42]MBC8989720.1 sugar ABC transporter permease [Micromonospora chalcea]MCK1805491.1 sugar ABC transporter permease [Micromonospora sp. R42106]MCK1832922.1 sugar ABC transporter permease [Micromonospora sp. R42003]MCK1844548.1 sugar ABC transporter permease [Micromonospora sp. R42004]